jgi:membrane protease YdiL (CAAX protease family)
VALLARPRQSPTLFPASPINRSIVFVNRALLIFALAGLWPLLRALGATSLREVGLRKPTAHWRTLLGGLLLGFASLALVAVVTLAAGGRAFIQNNDSMRLMEKIVGAALSAVVVAVLEETLFRGGIFGGLRRVFHWRVALVASSMIYAIVHFLESAKHEGAVTWLSGLELLPRMMRGFANWEQIVPGFFNLTVAACCSRWRISGPAIFIFPSACTRAGFSGSKAMARSRPTSRAPTPGCGARER